MNSDLARRRRRALGGAGLTVMAATLASKLLGFGRDTVLARQFGAGVSTNAFFVAAQVPLVLFAAVGVAIVTVFIPMFASLAATEDQPEAERFASRVNGAATLAVGALIVILEVGAGPAVSVMAPGFSGHERALTVEMVRIMAPLIMFYAWSAVVGGVLNTRGFFGPNAAMGIPQNLIIIGAILLASVHRHNILWVAWGMVAGTSATYLVQLPALRHTRFRIVWRFDFRHDPRLRAMAVLLAPAVVTALAQQLGIIVDKSLGSSLGPLLSDLVYASRLQLLAYSIPGLSIATVLYPSLAAAAGGAEMGVFRRTFTRGLGFVNFVTIPVAVGMFLLRQPLVRVLYQHGHFTPQDTLATAYTLAFFTAGVLGYGWQDFCNRAFFALKDTRDPMFAGFIAVGINVGLDFLLVHPMRQAGLALGTTVGWTCAAVYLAIRLRRHTGLLGGRALLSRTLRMAVAAAAGFLPAAWLLPRLAPVLGTGWRGDALGLVAVCLGAGAVYLAGCHLLRVPEVGDAGGMLRALARRPGTPAAGQVDG